MTTKLVKIAILSGVFATLAPGFVLAQAMEKKGTTPYVTHFLFRPMNRNSTARQTMMPNSSAVTA